MEKEILKKFLKDRGKRLTKERSSILQNAFSYHGHFNPEALYLKIKETGMKVSRASVYRTLSILSECGLIEKVMKTDQGTIYEHTFGHEHHDHMHCVSCGGIIEFYSKDIESLQEELCRRMKFKGVTHTLEIRGHCKKCQKKKKGKEKKD
jgi:Fur family ferric uptake transcriptional regulator